MPTKPHFSFTELWFFHYFLPKIFLFMRFLLISLPKIWEYLIYLIALAICQIYYFCWTWSFRPLTFDIWPFPLVVSHAILAVILRTRPQSFLSFPIYLYSFSISLHPFRSSISRLFMHIFVTFSCSRTPFIQLIFLHFQIFIVFGVIFYCL